MDDKTIKISVHEIKGNCPVFKKGDIIMIEGAKINLKKTDAVCIHALPSLLYYALSLREGAKAEKLGLTKSGQSAYIHCPDPGSQYTNGGSVIFQLTKK